MTDAPLVLVAFRKGRQLFSIVRKPTGELELHDSTGNELNTLAADLVESIDRVVLYAHGSKTPNPPLLAIPIIPGKLTTIAPDVGAGRLPEVRLALLLRCFV